MMLIIGLGNPGKKFVGTRHNTGFLIIEKFASIFKFPDFRTSRALFSKISQKEMGAETLTLAKPQTFMNDSGKAVVRLAKKYRVAPQNVIVVHDDLDIPLGKFKVSFSRGSAGHKGVQSLIENLSRKDFIRLRMGIGEKKAAIKAPEEFVLAKFTAQEKKALNATAQKAVLALIMIIEAGPEKAMAFFNQEQN